MEITTEQLKVCPICKRKTWRAVSLTDDGNSKRKVCVDCKKTYKEEMKSIYFFDKADEEGRLIKKQ